MKKCVLFLMIVVSIITANVAIAYSQEALPDESENNGSILDKVMTDQALQNARIKANFESVTPKEKTGLLLFPAILSGENLPAKFIEAVKLAKHSKSNIAVVQNFENSQLKVSKAAKESTIFAMSVPGQTVSENGTKKVRENIILVFNTDPNTKGGKVLAKLISSNDPTVARVLASQIILIRDQIRGLSESQALANQQDFLKN